MALQSSNYNVSSIWGPSEEESVLLKKVKDNLISHGYEGPDVGEEMEILRNAWNIIRSEVDNIKDCHYVGSFGDYEKTKEVIVGSEVDRMWPAHLSACKNVKSSRENKQFNSALCVFL